MFRVSIEPQSGGSLLRLAGRLDAESLDSLRAALGEATPVRCLELSELRWVDTGGITLLLELEAAAIELRGASPFLGLLLDEARTSAIAAPLQIPAAVGTRGSDSAGTIFASSRDDTCVDSDKGKKVRS